LVNIKTPEPYCKVLW